MTLLGLGRGLGMEQTRREFAGTVAALGALVATGASPAIGAAAAPVRISLAAFAKDPVRVASLRRGVATMKARPPSDHRSWFFQAAIHAYNDALYADALAKDPGVAKVDRERYWNKCTHFGQSSANFLIWHRAYLYYFERILRDASGDPGFALPYWDYSQADARVFPQIFASRFLDEERTPNPLYHANRELAFVVGALSLSPDIGAATPAIGSDSFFSDIGTTGFGGDILDSEHTELGLLEQRPHNDIHLAVGGVVGGNNGAMADVKTAAFDPVFFVHHANIDRMWATWSCAPGKQWGPLPPDEWLDEEAWIFLDVDGTEQRQSRRFYMERANLAVGYDTDSAAAALALPQIPPQPPAAPAPAGAEAGGAENEAAPPTATMETPEMPRAAPPRERELFANHVALVVSPRAAAGAEFGGMAAPTGGARHAKGNPRRTPHPPTVGAAAPVLTAPLVLAANERVVLELVDIRFDRVPSSGFAIYLATVAEAAGHSQGTLVGLLDLFGATHMQMPGMKASQRFDVTRIVSASTGPYTLHVAPYSLFAKSAAAPARPDSVRIGSVRFVVVS
jgi:hypothetical protein